LAGPHGSAYESNWKGFVSSPKINNPMDREGSVLVRGR
jgi:hypothetical protein